MSEPYLIAHLVRGEPAFDIAIQLPIGDELGWIIPTSGHRAYPYWHMPIGQLYVESLGPVYSFIPEPPTNHPDHYAANDRHRMKALDEDTLLAKEAARPGQGLISNLAERLGLIPKPPTITRR